MEVKEILQSFKTDCFAYGTKGCAALKETCCWDCAFYKTRAQLEKEHQKVKERLNNLP